MYLSTLMLEELESRAGITPASAALQAAAWVNRPTGREIERRANAFAFTRPNFVLDYSDLETRALRWMRFCRDSVVEFPI